MRGRVIDDSTDFPARYCGTQCIEPLVLELEWTEPCQIREKYMGQSSAL